MLKSYNRFIKISETLSGSEAVFAFAAWLTTRKKRTTMSEKDDAGEAARLVGEFIDKQGLVQPREDGSWVDEIIPMTEKQVAVDKNDEIFNYNSIVGNLWQPAINAARKFYKINFDLENDESTKEKKVIHITGKNQQKYKVRAELWKAGGDWEWPVMYFKIQFDNKYDIISCIPEKKPKHIWQLDDPKNVLNRCYVIIPPADAGNKLVKTDSGWRAYQDDDIPADNKGIAKVSEADMAMAWKWLEQYLTDAISENNQ